MISLFAEQKAVHRGVSPVVLSCGLHVVGLGVLSFGILHMPRIQQPIVTERYSVRQLDLHSPELRTKKSAESENLYPRADAGAPESSRAALAVNPLPPLSEVPHGVEGKQTLVQPDIRTHVALPENAPVPTVVIWTPEVASTKQIVAPLPEKPSAMEAKPSLKTPNERLDPGELAIAAATTEPKVEIPPSGTTSPLVVHADSIQHKAPATVSNSADQPTPTAVISISDVRMTEGTIVLPPVNETHSTPQKNDTAPTATPASQAASHGTGTGEGTGTHSDGSDKPSSIAGGHDKQTTEHIRLPKDGKFGVIVVGTSLAEQYPETLQIWSDRVAYTAYLHVGLAKNWILQYAQLRSAEAATNGTVARLEAPWPYDILRPNLVSLDLNADALMVHGILNESGRLESLAIAFPEQFSHAAFVLRTLQQWQFRPARQQGKPTSVEVLLIIPDDLD